MASQAHHSRTGEGVEMVAVPRSGGYVKEVPDIDIASPETDIEFDEHGDGFKSTSADAVNMHRMGKNQQLVRHFRVLSMASFVAIATAVWEIGLFNLTPGLINGGRPGLVYSVLWNFIGFGPIYLSMAEMASMAPIAGAQYHWVSEFAPESMQRALSYFTG
jgi:choline transport protein